MDEKELVVELERFLNETGNYQSFLSWAEARGLDPVQLEEDLNKAIED